MYSPYMQVPHYPAGCRPGVRGAAHNLNRLLGMRVAHGEVALASDTRVALRDKGPFGPTINDRTHHSRRMYVHM